MSRAMPCTSASALYTTIKVFFVFAKTTSTLSTTLEPATNTTAHTTTSPAMDK